MTNSSSQSNGPMAQQPIIIIQVTVGTPMAQPPTHSPAEIPFSYPTPPLAPTVTPYTNPPKEGKSGLQRLYWIVGISGAIITAAIAIYHLWKNHGR